MKAKIVNIGNSKGIRIPKPLLEECGISNEVELNVQNGEIIIQPLKSTRAGWVAAFKNMALDKEDNLVDELLQTNWDKDEWEW